MSFFDTIRGTFESLFRLGKGGPQWKNNSGVMESRNADDSDFGITRGDSPVGDDDYTTRKFVEDNFVGSGGGSPGAVIVNWMADSSGPSEVTTNAAGGRS